MTDYRFHYRQERFSTAIDRRSGAVFFLVSFEVKHDK